MQAPISRARYVQENRKMRFEQALQGWTAGRLTQAEAAMLLGQCERSFRRHVERYGADGLEGLLDKRLSQISKRRASAGEVDQVVQTYKSGFAGWNVAHFHSKYRSEFKGTRSYSWVKTVLQGAGLARKAKARGKHRIKRERAPLPGMMLHQDASTHRWVPGEVWDLVVTMDDATGEHTSMFLQRRGRHGVELSWPGPDHRPLRAVRQRVQRSRQPLLPDPDGWRQGRQAATHGGRPRAQAVGHRAHRRVLA